MSEIVTIRLIHSKSDDFINVEKRKDEINFQMIRDLMEDYEDVEFVKIYCDCDSNIDLQTIAKMVEGDIQYFINLQRSERAVIALQLLKYLSMFLLDYKPDCSFRNFLFGNLKLNKWNSEMIAKYSRYLNYFYGPIYLSEEFSDRKRESMMESKNSAAVKLYDSILGNGEFTKIIEKIQKYMNENTKTLTNILLVTEWTKWNADSGFYKRWLVKSFYKKGDDKVYGGRKNNNKKIKNSILLQDLPHNKKVRYAAYDDLFVIDPQLAADLGDSEYDVYLQDIETKISPDGKYFVLDSYLSPTTLMKNKFRHVYEIDCWFRNFVRIDKDGNYVFANLVVESEDEADREQRKKNSNNINVYFYYPDGKTKRRVVKIDTDKYFEDNKDKDRYEYGIIDYNWKYRFFVLQKIGTIITVLRKVNGEYCICYPEQFRNINQIIFTKCNEYMITSSIVSNHSIRIKVYRCLDIANKPWTELKSVFKYTISTEYFAFDDLLSLKLYKFYMKLNGDQFCESDSDNDTDFVNSVRIESDEDDNVEKQYEDDNSSSDDEDFKNRLNAERIRIREGKKKPGTDDSD